MKGRFRFGQVNIPDDRVDSLMLALWGVRNGRPGGGGMNLVNFVGDFSLPHQGGGLSLGGFSGDHVVY